MKVYTTDKIRNVVLLGHGGSGKTTLAEAMCYLSGVTSRMGKVEDGNTVSDFTKEEQKRGISIKTAVMPIEWQDIKINVLDTPGYFDFVGEVEEAMSVADAAIIVISGKSGIEAGTERAWDLCERFNLPRMFYVSDMDVDNVSYREIIENLTNEFGKKIAPFNFPIREDGNYVGYVNVVSEKAFRWKDKDAVEADIPDYSEEYLEQYRDTLMETVAETSEEFMDRYFSGDTFSEAEIRSAVRVNIQDGSIVPVECGASNICRGVYTLLDDIVKYMPSADTRSVNGINMKTNEIFEANFDFSKPKSGFIFKTIVDPFIGRYSLIKVRSGVFKTDDMVYDSELETEIKLGKIYIMQGNKTYEVPELHAGDVGAVAKLGDARTGDTLSTKATPIQYPKMDISKPYTYLRYKVEIETEKPKVAYRETIRKTSDVEYKYKKQSGGHGQYGHVKMKFSPSGNLDEAYEFDQEVVGGTVPKNYFPAVEKGIIDSVQRGPLAAYPVVGVRAVLYDGSYHPVDSSEMAFKTASVQAFKKGFIEAGPVLLEPIVSLKVTIPDAYTGDVMGDLNKRRGRVLGMNPIQGGKQVIEAEVPQSELFDYCTVLRSISGGRGDYSYEFARYEQAPQDIQSKEVEARAAAVADGTAD